MPTQPKTWTMHDIPTREDLADYRNLVQAVGDALPGASGLPALPESMDKLSFAGANDIERFLAEAYGMITKIELSWFYSGEIAAGGF